MRTIPQTILLFCFVIFGRAQEAEIIGFQLQKQFIENGEEFFTIGIKVLEDESFTGVSESSTIHSLVDDRGFDILKAHQAVADKNLRQLRDSGSYRLGQEQQQRFILFKESRPLPGDSGFLLVLRSWDLPSNGSKELQLKATIDYQVSDPGTEHEVLIETVDFGSETWIPWQGKQLSFDQWKYTDSVKGERFRIQLKNADLGVAVQKIELIGPDGKTLNDLKVNIYPDHVEFSLDQIAIPINLRITYKDLKKKTILIDKKLSIGI